MGRLSLIPKRRGNSVSTDKTALIQPLEPRLLLASSSTASNVFAQFQGTITSPTSTVSIPLNFSSSNFTFSGGQSVLGVQVLAADGSHLDPAIVQIKDARNRALKTIFKNSNLAAKKQSLALASFSSGKYKLTVSSDRHTTGAFIVKLFLAGDASGDRQVSAADATSIKKNLGRRTGQKGYSTLADSNLNGTIDNFDLAQATANNKDKTSLQVLPLSVFLDSIARRPDGTFVTNQSTLTFRGSTLKNFKISLDKDGDGFDDGTIKANNRGGYRGDINLASGPNTLALRVADSLGQQKTSTISITLDTTAPTIANLGLADGFQLPGAATNTTTARAVTITGTTEPGSTVSILLPAAHATAAADGTFSIPDVRLASGANSLTITVTDPAGNSSIIPLTLTRVAPNDDAQIVLDWDAALLSAIQANASSAPEASRQMAIVHAAIYDALNAIDRTSSFLYTTSPAAADASPKAAVAAAAHATLRYLFPAQTATFDALLLDSFSAISDGQSKTDGIALGESVANTMIALRQNDGSSIYIPYTPTTTAGHWQPAPTDSSAALLPNWADLRPFLMNSPDVFSPPAPPTLDSPEFAADLAESLALGKRDSATRSADQTAIANFWFDGAGSVTPAGHWNQIAAQVAGARNSSLFDTARMFAVLDLAMADATIIAWHAKYEHDFWRPATAAAATDPTWAPLQNTPNSPEYLPEQSTISGAAAWVLRDFFGFVPFTATAPSSAPRSFTSFDSAAREAANSGIYAGTDFRTSTQRGLFAGENIGELALLSFSESRPTPPSIQLLTTEKSFHTNPAITGHVNSPFWSIKSLQASIDSKKLTTLAIDELGNFTFTPSLALNASADEVHTIAFTVTDSIGQQSTTTFVFTLDTKVPTIALTSPAANSQLSAAKHLTGKANGTGSAIAALSYSFDNRPAIPITFTTTGAFDEPLDLSKLATGPHVLSISATDAAGNTTTLTRNLTLPSAIPLTITATSPTNGAVDIGPTIHPRITFSRAIDPTTLNSSNFFATALGQKLPATIVPSADGTSTSLFLTDPLPGATLVQVTVDGFGGASTFSFTTSSLTNVPGTSLHGALADLGPDQTPNTPDDQPLAGATVSILGQSDASVITAADGSFDFDAVPTGDIKLLVDDQIFELHINPSTDNTATLYLARPAPLGDAASSPHLTNEQRSRLSLDIPANSLLQPDGSKLATTQVTLTTLPSQLATTLPGELQHAFLINIQTPGAVAFDQPASLTFPNIFSAAPGAKLNIISFNNATGRAETSATATVSADGLSVHTDPGQGITHPGIHGLAPPGGTIFATGASLGPNDYVAVQIGNGIPLRTRTDNAGRFSFFLPPDQPYALTIFDPGTGKISHSSGSTPHSAQSTNVSSSLVFNTSTQIDSDLDGLPADVEFAIGTDASRKDSNGDGLNDNAAILNRIDPTAPRPYPTAVVASLSLWGEANDIAINPSQHRAYIATGSAGLAIADVAQFDRPILLGQLDLVGDSVSVAVDAGLNIAAVGAGSGGLHLVNVATPTAPVLLQTIGTDARAVAIVDGVAYVATGTGLESYDLLTGEQLQSLTLAGGAVSLAVEGDMIYTMDSSNRLRAIDISGPQMIARASLITPEGGGKIFVGNNIVTIAAASKANGGFDTVDVSNPDSLLLLSGSDIAPDAGAPASAIAANGSGRTIVVGQTNFAFGGATALDVFDSSDLADTAHSLSRILLPGEPSAIAIHSGIAYLAGGSAGLQVVNYLPFDNKSVPPTAMLAARDVLLASGGSTVHLRADISDDVQIRSLEVLVNGQVVSTANSFPFDLSATLPKVFAGGVSINAQLRVTDTGGNTALSNILTLSTLPDPIQPTVTAVTPDAGAKRSISTRSIRIDFSEPIDPATATAQNIRLLDSSNHPLAPIDIQTRRDDKSVQLTYDNLPVGDYQIVVNSGVTDRAGNTLLNFVASSFTIAQGTIIWTNNAGGDWSNAANWDLGRVPNTTDDVFISTAPGAVITHASGSDTIASLRSNSPFTLSGGTLTVTRQAIFNSALTLSGGMLTGAGAITANGNVTWSNTILQGPGVTNFSQQSSVSIPVSSFPAISGRIVNVNGTMNVASALILSGSAGLNNGGTLNIAGDIGISSTGGSSSISNSGTFVKTSGSGNSNLSLPISNRGTLSANSGTLILSGGGSSGGRISTASGATIKFNSSAFTFTGGASFSGPGLIRISTGANNVNAAVTIPNLTLDGGTLASPAHANIKITGNFTWTAGTIGPGPNINIANSASLNISGSSSKTLTSATISNSANGTWSGSGALSLTTSTFNNSGQFTIQNDLTLTGGATSTFNNSGTLIKSASAGSTTFALTFNNSGSVALHSGNLRFNTGGLASGAFSADASTNITFLTTPYALNGATFSGAGTVHLTNTVLTTSGAVSASNFSFEGGNIDGAGAFTVNNSLNWTGGAFLGSGSTTFAPTATVSINGNANKVIEARTINNEGSLLWSGTGPVFTRSSTFNNFGAFTIQNDTTWNNNGGTISTLNNLGTLLKQSAPGASSFGVIFNNSGTLSVQSGSVGFTSGGASSGAFNTAVTGSINFNGGTHTLAQGSLLSGGGAISVTDGAVSFDGPDHFSGTLSVSGAGAASFKRPTTLTNLNVSGSALFGAVSLHVTGTMNWSGVSTLDGTAFGTATIMIDPGATLTISDNVTMNHYTLVNSGTLNIGSPTGLANLSADFVQTSSGILNIDISGISTFDKLNIIGNATLAGKLNIKLNSFTPTSGNTFQILSATSILGTFDAITGDTSLFTINYNTNNVTLIA